LVIRVEKCSGEAAGISEEQRKEAGWPQGVTAYIRGTLPSMPAQMRAHLPNPGKIGASW
jgi:hypothetical protein